MTFDEIGMNELLELYKRKDELIKTGNLSELSKLKNLCPDLFVEEKRREIDELEEMRKHLMEHPHFKAMMREENKRRLIPIDYEQWKIGLLSETLDKHEKIWHGNMHEASRALVKEAIVMCRLVCEEQEKRNINIPLIFPFMGLLISELFIQYPKENRELTLKSLLFKLRGKDPSLEKPSEEKLNEWKTKISYSQVEEKIRNNFRSMLKKIMLKFDTRKEFYRDSVFFCLLEVTDFICRLIISRIGVEEGESESLVINRVESNIRYGINGSVYVKN